jgi:hypothetical protein
MATRTRWLRAACIVAAFTLALTFLLEPADLRAGLHGPDGRNYASLLHSLWFDRDLLLYNDNALLGQNLLVTPTGYALELHNIGTALAFLPFYAIGQLACPLAGGECGADGLSAGVWLSLGNWAYGVLALVVMWRLVARHTAPRYATVSVSAVALGSSFFYYWTRFFNPHMPALLLVAVLVLVWDSTQDRRAWHHWLLMGVLGGAAMCIASYNAAVLMLPAFDVARSTWRRRALAWREVMLLGGGVLAGFAPQLVAWRLLFGSFLGTPYGQQLFWLQPGLPDILLSTYHGLYFYAPLLLIATAGFVPLWRQDRRLAAALLLTLATQVYVSSCNIAWWGGASFGARYLLTSLPLLAVPLGVLLSAARWRGLLYAAMAACIVWTYGLFLADFARLIDPGQYIPAAWQVRAQARVVSELPGLLRRHLMTPRFAAALLVAVPSALWLTGMAWYAGRSRRLRGPSVALVLTGLFLTAAGLLAASDWPSQREIARLMADGTITAYPRETYDRYDLSEGYWQRGAYRFVRGRLDAARADFETAQQIDPDRGWVRFHTAGRRHVPHPLEWQVDDRLTLVGWEMGPLTATLYWVAGSPVLSPMYRTALRLLDAGGEEVAAYAANAPDAWRALSGDVVRVSYPLPRAATAEPHSLSIDVYRAGEDQPVGHLEVASDEP